MTFLWLPLSRQGWQNQKEPGNGSGKNKFTLKNEGIIRW